MYRTIGEVTSWVRSLAIAASATLIAMSSLGAVFVLTEPGTPVRDLLVDTTVDQRIYFLSREGLSVWRLAIDPDHKQLFLLDWVLRNFTLALAMLVLGIGLRMEGVSVGLAARAYIVGGTLSGFFLPYLYRIATGAKPYFHIILDAFNPFYVSASAPLALAGGFFGMVFFGLRLGAIRRRLKMSSNL